MPGYTRLVNKEIEFDGEVIKYSFRRLKRAEFLELSVFFETVNGETKLVEGKGNEYIETMSNLLPDLIESFSGLTIDGEEFRYQGSSEELETLTGLIDELYFQELFQSILLEITLESQGPGGKTEKKLDSTPSESSAD